MAQPYPASRRRYPIWTWPFLAIWKIITWVANAIGILLTLLIGAVCMFLGFWLTMTVIGAVVGIPLFIMGLLLFVRGLW